MKKFSIILLLLLVVIVAVGSVSAAENATSDIVDTSSDAVAIEEIATDVVADEVAVDGIEDTNDDVQTPTRTSYTVNSGMTSDEINAVISNASENGGGTINFEPGTYSGMALTLKNNTHLIGGSGVLLWGTSYNHVIEVANVENFTISGLTINANYLAGNGNISAIHGSFATNGVISGNTLYNGYNGININKKYDNLTIQDNTIYAIKYDGISLANPQNNDNYLNITGANIIHNSIESEDYGIFIGGTFKGNISNNVIRLSKCAIQFLGKPYNNTGHLIANINGNNISDVTTGIELYHPDVIYLNVTSNRINLYSTFGYYLKYDGRFHKSADGYIGFLLNTFKGRIQQSFVDQTDIFDNLNNGTIVNS